MFPRVTHPSAAPVLLRALDLHVLSLPPAFVLSQDQTLKLNEILILTGQLAQERPLAKKSLDLCRGLESPFDEFQTHSPQAPPAPTVSRRSAQTSSKKEWLSET